MHVLAVIFVIIGFLDVRPGIDLYPWEAENPPPCPVGYEDCHWTAWAVTENNHTCDGGRKVHWLTSPNGRVVFGAMCWHMVWIAPVYKGEGITILCPPGAEECPVLPP